MQIVEPVGQGVRVGLRRHGQFGEPTVGVPTREARVLAEVLLVAQAEPAGPACRSQPGDSYPLSLLESRRARAGTDDLAHDLVPGNDPSTLGGQLAVAEVEVGPAHAAGADGQQHLPGARHRSRLLDQAEPALGLAGPSGLDDPGPHHPAGFITEALVTGPD